MARVVRLHLLALNNDRIGYMKKVDGSKYKWSSIYNLSNMLDWLSTRKKVDVIHVSNAENASGMWSSYGDCLQYVKEAYLFDDNSILVCASISSWGGTFASHDQISVQYYALTEK